MANWTITVNKEIMLFAGEKLIRGTAVGVTYDTSGSEFDVAAYFEKDATPYVLCTCSGGNTLTHNGGTAESGTVYLWNADGTQYTNAASTTWADVHFIAVGNAR